MMRAWYFAEALAKQEAAALPYLQRKGDAALLDEWTRRKAIQKAIESRRISFHHEGTAPHDALIIDDVAAFLICASTFAMRYFGMSANRGGRLGYPVVQRAR